VALAPGGEACQVVFAPSEDGRQVEMTGSASCVDNTVLQFVFIDGDGNQVYDGGVYVGNASVWQTRLGVFEVIDKITDELIATISVTTDISIL